MKKVLLTIGLGALFIATLSSCMIAMPGMGGAANASAYGHSLEYKYKDGSYEKIKLKMDESYNLLDKENKLDLINDYYLAINSYVMEIATYMNFEHLQSSIKQNKRNDDNYLRLQEHLTNLLAWNNDFLLKASSSEYKNDFFPNMTDEEIEDSLDKKYDPRFNEINGEIERLLLDYRALGEKDKLKEASSYYSKIVKGYNEMSSLAGYNNYLEYSYKEVYDRDYSPKYILGFNENVKKYIVPELKEANEAVTSLEDRISRRHFSKVAEILTTSYLDSSYLADKYSEYIGGSYFMNYEELFDNGYYYFSNEKNAQNGAYTTYLYSVDSPAVYFGPDYMDTMTVIHEFGHYFAFKENDGWSGSFDLAETQSQGNELLFLAYLIEEGGYYEHVNEGVKAILIENYLKTILLATIVNDFELFVYDGNITDANQYDNIFIDICNRYLPYEELKRIYGFELTDYWKLVALENAGYYISYAVSLIPSLELYLKASADLEAGVDSLMNLIKDVRMDESYIVTLNNAGLISPFNEEAYKDIHTLIS